MLGKVVVGSILDKKGLLKGGLIAFTMSVVAVLSLIAMKSIPAVSILYIVLAGGGLMMSAIAMPMYIFNIIFMIIGAVGSILALNTGKTLTVSKSAKM